MMDGTKSAVMVTIINSNTQQKKGRVTLTHPRKDIPVGTLKSIAKQSGVTFK